MHLDADAYGVLLTVTGLGLSFWRLKRKFDRTNSAGVESFSGFGQKMVATTLDGMLQWVGLASLFLGLLILAFV